MNAIDEIFSAFQAFVAPDGISVGLEIAFLCK